MMADPRVAQYVAVDGKPLSRFAAWQSFASMVGHWALRGFGMFAVVERATGVLVGRVGPWQPESWPAFEIGWTIRSDYWGRGYATEAASRCFDYAFSELQQRYVASFILPGNDRSIAVATRVGEQLDTTTTLPHLGERRVLQYGVTRAQWESRRGYSASREWPGSSNNDRLRARISDALTQVFRVHPAVLAGWEGGSAAFGKVDAYSDIDLEYLVSDDMPFEDLYAIAESALEEVSPITARHVPAVGRYYKLKDGGDFLLVDLIFHRVGDADHHLDVERHGKAVPLFDKGEWLRPRAFDDKARAVQRDRRYRELQTWFPMSQVFVRKAIARSQDVEAINAFWACTLKPLADLLRMRHCPARWDFGVRYLDRDLPPAVYEQIRNLALVNNLNELESKLASATEWGTALLRDLETA